MKTGKASFRYKMNHDLRYRLMTAMLVCVLPIGIVSCVLFGMVWVRTGREIRSTNQARLDEAMSYWERDCHTVERAMDYFVSVNMEELNYDHLSWSDVTRYHMFSQLETILPEAAHNGLVALHDIHGGKTLAQVSDPGMDAAAVDRLVQEFSDMIVRGEEMPGNTWQQIGEKHYLLQRFDYRNGSIFFALDVEAALRERLAPFLDEGAGIYVADGYKILELTDHGPQETNLTWEACTAASLNRSTLSWASQKMSVAVCIVDEQGVLAMIPWECWALLLVVLACLGTALCLPRLIRLEVLDPAKKLRNALYQIQTDHLDYRLKDTYYRNSDDMQYLFDSFDKMAEEVEASREKDKKMYQAELNNLRLQVNPHMLLNSLNTIYSLAQMRKYEAIQEYSLHLVDYFRYALRRNDNLVSVEQEVDFIKTYVEIQKIRYPGALAFSYSIGEGCAGAKVPPLLIQNFVENAVKYGVKPGKVTEILVKIHKNGDRMEISVNNTGSEIRPEVLESLQKGEVVVDAMGHKHIGVWNCRRRIEVFYKEQPRLEILSGQDGTRVVLDIPYWTEVQQ